jgi:hypothetical protein
MKTRLLGTIVLLASAALFAQEISPVQGGATRTFEEFPLETRQIIVPLNEKLIPKLEAELKDATGADIKYDVDWKAMGKPLFMLTQLDGALKTINDALVGIAKQPMGKEVVASKIKTIRVENGKGEPVTLKDGVLRILPTGSQWRMMKVPSTQARIKALL